MRVLAIDTALGACAAAVLDTERDILAQQSRAMIRGHAENLMPLLSALMEEAKTAFDDLDRIAVTIGPGSFTGLRVGLSAARAIGLAAGKPVIGLSTLAAYAAPQVADDDTISVLAAIDARHDQVYVQMFGPGGRTTLSPRIVRIDEAVRAAGAAAVRLTGSAAGLLAQAWSGPPPLSVDARAAPEIDWVARLGAAAIESQSPPRPLYMRAPDAQPQDAAQLPRR
ncbi:MAG: tRNA (adenosine(37)-N6)-threonylcarbamoyltransferase complex dimerization subunit type 1 TsaB [Pseudorhodoplanes sp.]